MFVKVCGITTFDQAKEISQLVDYIGFIFYAASPRNIEHSFPSLKAKKVGVFVNEPLAQLMEIARLEKLNAVQLHGSESPEYCAALTGQIEVFKSFGISDNFNFAETTEYEPFVDYFLFDTKTPDHGGSGIPFNWTKLNEYCGKTPFILAGGLSPSILAELKSFKHPNFVGIDLNSGFESEPGIKKTAILKQFLHDIRN